MSDKMEMTLGISLLMAEIIEKLLYKVEDHDGNKVLVDRDIPFRLRYRLNKNLVMFNKDVQFFNQKKLLYLAHFGEPSEDGKNVVIKDEHKMELYKEAIGALVDSKVEHNIMTLEPEDLEKLEDSDIKISPEAMTLFIGYMTNDPELDKDLSYNIRVNTPNFKKTEEPVVDKEPAVDQEPDKTEAPKEEVKAEEPVKEEVKTEVAETEKPKAVKKTTTKKKTAKAADDAAEKPKKTKTQKKIENILEGKPVFDDVPHGEVVAKPKKTTRKKKTEVADEQ